MPRNRSDKKPKVLEGPTGAGDFSWEETLGESRAAANVSISSRREVVECEFHGTQQSFYQWSFNDYESERVCFICYAEAQVELVRKHQAKKRGPLARRRMMLGLSGTTRREEE